MCKKYMICDFHMLLLAYNGKAKNMYPSIFNYGRSHAWNKEFRNNGLENVYRTKSIAQFKCNKAVRSHA